MNISYINFLSAAKAVLGKLTSSNTHGRKLSKPLCKEVKTKQRKRNRKGDFLKAKMGEHKKHERIKQKQI